MVNSRDLSGEKLPLCGAYFPPAARASWAEAAAPFFWWRMGQAGPVCLPPHLLQEFEDDRVSEDKIGLHKIKKLI